MDRDEELLSSLGGWAGFEIAGFERREGDPEEIWITLRRKDEAPLLCGACGREASRVHERQERIVRDLPLFDARTYLKIESCRVWCEHCGAAKRQQIDWVDDQQRLTRRFAESILSLCSHVAISHIAQFFSVHWHTVKRLDKRRLRERFARTDYSDVRVIGVDEFALHKGHRCATVVVEPSRRRVLWGGNRAARRVVKSSRWLLLRNRDSLSSEDQQVRLDELLEANQALMTTYVLRDDLKQLWRYRHRGYAKRAWEGWYQRAMASGIAPLMRFAERLKPYLHGILAHTRWPLHTSLVEGINNRIKVIKRTAYGFRDDEYFFLKTKAAFPG